MLVIVGAAVALLCANLIVEQSERSHGKAVGYTGEWQEADKSSPEIIKVVQNVTAYLESACHSEKAYRLKKILNAQFQIVSGTKYKFVLLIAQTECGRGLNAGNCNDVVVGMFPVLVWSKPWESFFQVTNYTCWRERSSGHGQIRASWRQIIGGQSPISVSNPEVLDVARFATEEMSNRTGGHLLYKFQRIISGTKQVVSGIVYRLIIEVSVTPSNYDQATTRVCAVKVWDQRWREPRYTLEYYACNRGLALHSSRPTYVPTPIV